MSEPVATPCPSCGLPASGNFCTACGTRLSAPSCPGCGATAAAGTRFCTRCGTPLAGVAAHAGEPRTPWLVATVLSVLTIVLVLVAAGARSRAAAPDMANAGGAGAAPVGVPVGPAPDISNMTPREQFTRLNDRILAAAERGDTSTVISFWPMAAGAYDNLPPADRDADARYHMATLHLLVGRLPATLALADSILAESPDHLLGWYLRAVVAEFEGDSAAARDARRAFRSAYDTEIARGLQEYVEHAPMLQSFLNQATP